MTQLEQIISQIPDVQLRLALTGAVFMASDNAKAFEAKYGTYGLDGLKRLMDSAS